jgi:hypothetical protein
MARILGLIIALIGFIGLFTRGIETVFFCLIGIALVFTRHGVLIDLKEGKLKIYTEAFWIKVGKWETFKKYPYLTVLEITERNSMYSRANVEYSRRKLIYRITLLNDNHYNKILLKQMNNKEDAHTKASEIAKFLNIEKVIYSPS